MNTPACVIEPPVALQVTAVLLEPVTVATKVCVAPGARVAAVGVSDTATTGGAVTVTAADALFAVSARLVATT